MGTIKLITDEVTPPDFEDAAGNYFQDERGVKAGIQLQKDAWNSAVETIVDYINKKGMVSVQEISMLKNLWTHRG